ncbi:MAG: hypothetical protein AB7Q76_18075 [Gammaproteobacteria bacterium]
MPLFPGLFTGRDVLATSSSSDFIRTEHKPAEEISMAAVREVLASVEARAREGRHEARAFDRALLPAVAAIDGPRIVEEATATTLVQPARTIHVDDYGFLHITV